jgi:hypothetical protein
MCRQIWLEVIATSAIESKAACLLSTGPSCLALPSLAGSIAHAKVIMCIQAQRPMSPMISVL